jgi:hypothetical protein
MVWAKVANSGVSCSLLDKNSGDGGHCCCSHSGRFGSSGGLLSSCHSIALTGGNSGCLDVELIVS